MESLIPNQKGMTSLEIAEVTGKQHAHIMRDIRKLLSQGVTASNFGLSEYKDTTGRKLPCFSLTPKGCLILASGYDAQQYGCRDCSVFNIFQISGKKITGVIQKSMFYF